MIVCDTLEKKMNSKNSEQDEAVDRQSQHFTGLCQALEQKLKEKSNWLDEKFSDVCTLLDKKFTEETGKNADRIENEHRFFNELCQGLGKDLNDKTGDLDDRLTAASAKLEANIAAVDAKLNIGWTGQLPCL